MTWQNAVTVAEAWIAEHLPHDLKGKFFHVPDFPDDATALFFNPERPKLFHDMVTKAICRAARKRGAKIRHHVIDADTYAAVLKVTDREDSVDERNNYLASMFSIDAT